MRGDPMKLLSVMNTFEEPDSETEQKLKKNTEFEGDFCCFAVYFFI